MATAEEQAATWQGTHVIKGKRAYATTPMGQVHYSTLGDGPPLLLVHQSPWFSVQYAKVQPLLAEMGILVIAADTPGFGFSDVPDHPPTADEYAANISSFLDALGISRVSIAGHHTGATISAAFAARYPERTACVIMHGVPLYTEAERTDRLANQLHAGAGLKRDASHIIDRWQRIERSFAHDAETESIQWAVMAFLMAGDLEWYGHRAAFTFDMESAIAAIKSPTLIMSNTADTIHQSAARVLKMRPDFAYREFAGGNSHMMYDYPEPWAQTVGEFIKAKSSLA
ncbi:MAG: alpha/beta hydrolase [Rhodobacteraceae bacterium]|nr:alpha/beta hydrolase [Paracoccaceae bacterium]